MDFSVLLGNNPHTPVRNTFNCSQFFTCSYRKSVCRKMGKKAGREKGHETKEENKIKI